MNKEAKLINRFLGWLVRLTDADQIEWNEGHVATMHLCLLDGQAAYIEILNNGIVFGFRGEKIDSNQFNLTPVVKAIDRQYWRRKLPLINFQPASKSASGKLASFASKVVHFSKNGRMK